MIGPALLLLGAYLAISPGGDMFMLPKLVAIFAGAFLCLWRPQRTGTLRPYFLLCLGAMAMSAHSTQSWIGLYRSPTVGIAGALAVWLSYEAGLTATPRAWKWVKAGAASCSVLALLQLIPRAPFHGILSEAGGRAIGTIGSPPLMGCMLALALPLGGAWTILVIATAILAARSKAAILGAIAGAAVRWRVPAWAAGIGAVAVVVALNRGASDTMRIYIWGIAWKVFLAHPLLGVGAENFGDAFMGLRGPAWIEAGGQGMSAAENAHNLLLNVLATGGVFGIITRGILAWKAWPAVRSSAALMASCVSVLVYGLFEPVPFMAWAVLAFMVGSL